jgi:hypothetical protein
MLFIGHRYIPDLLGKIPANFYQDLMSSNYPTYTQIFNPNLAMIAAQRGFYQQGNFDFGAALLISKVANSRRLCVTKRRPRAYK